jgi:bifunctional non-homologous end joining protein LigD
MIFDQACQHGWEGIMCKRFDRPYQHTRSPDWLKVKCKQNQEFIIAGYTEPKGSRKYFGALILASREKSKDKALKFVGKVGTGFTHDILENVFRKLKKIETKTSPFEKPRLREANIHWVKSELVAEIEFSSWTNDGILRQPSFKGLREDKRSTQVTIEKPKSVETVVKEQKKKSKTTLTHPDRVIFPDLGITKGDLAVYFEMVQDLMFPFVKERPLALVRCPAGIDKGCFFQQNAKIAMSKEQGLGFISIKEAGSRLQIESIEGLKGLVQHGNIEIHIWGSRSFAIENPDQLVFDLDPDPSVSWNQILKGAKLLIEELRSQKLVPFLKLTGGKGLHIHVPILPRHSWSVVHDFAETFARNIEALEPSLFTTAPAKKKRAGRIYIDYLRNSRGLTFIAPYSPRAKPIASVATPIFEDELNEKIKPDRFTVKNMKNRISKKSLDPWADFESSAREIPAV